MQRYSWLLGVLGMCACSGSSIDVGPTSTAGAPGNDNSASAGSGNGSGSGSTNAAPAELACTSEAPLPTWPSADACASASNLPLVGTWHGYVEQQGAPWDDLTLVIRGASVSGGVCGTLTFGSGPIPAPATEKDSSYPDPNAPIAMRAGLTPGFPLTLLKGNTDGTRLRFSVVNGEVMRSWCALQDSYDWGGAPCSCVPNWGGGGIGDGQCKAPDPAHKHDLIMNCNRFAMCSFPGTCACNAQGCDATPESISSEFDLRFTANAAEGSDSSHTGLRTYFTRVP